MKKINPISFTKGLWRILTGKPRIPPSLQNNQLLTTILNRRSVRSFSNQKIPDDVFNAILEAGRLAPSTVNLQTWTFGVFTPSQWKDIFGGSIPFKANKAIMILGDNYRIKQAEISFPTSPLIEYTIAVMNASLAAMNMNIAAEALGISSVMLSETGRSGLLDMAYIKDKLSLPDNVFPLMTMVFGYARAAYPPMPPKFPMNQIIFSSQYPVPDRKVMDDWVAQMMSGYKASHLNSSFESQLEVYKTKIASAEDNLKKMIFNSPE